MISVTVAALFIRRYFTLQTEMNSLTIHEHFSPELGVPEESQGTFANAVCVSRIRPCSTSGEGGPRETTLVQLVSIHKHSTNQLVSQSIGRRQRFLFFSFSFFSLFSSFPPFFSFLSLSFSFCFSFPLLFPPPVTPFLFRRQADLYYARQTRRRQSVCDRVGAVVPSSVVALSAGWQRGWCPRRKRGPRGTR